MLLIDNSFILLLLLYIHTYLRGFGVLGKDGLFASSKYESDMHISNSPHVFVFANFEPIFPDDDCYDYNSRWIVCKITGEDDHLKLQESS